MCASGGIKPILYCSESFNSESSSLARAVSTNNMKIGFRLAVVLGKMYSIVVKSGISSAGNYCCVMCYA